MLICINSIYAQTGKYLTEIKKTVSASINLKKNLSNLEKDESLHQIMSLLTKDSRIVSQSPWFEIEIDAITQNNGTKKIQFIYDFGTQVSLTSEVLFLNNGKLYSYNFSFLKEYPKFNHTIWGVNNNKNLNERTHLHDRIQKLIGEEYLNFIKNSSFQRSSFDNDLYWEKHTKIYGNWEKSVIIVYQTKDDVLYVLVNNESKAYKFSENSKFPEDIRAILNFINTKLFQN